MPPRSPRPPALATDAPLPSAAGSGDIASRDRVISFPGPRTDDRADLLRGPLSTSTPAVIPDPCQGEVTGARIVRPAPHGAAESVGQVGHWPPGATSPVVRADDTRCVCPLAAHFTDTERALMDDITDQAARLATALRWLLALAALAGLVLLMRWSR